MILSAVPNFDIFDIDISLILLYSEWRDVYIFEISVVLERQIMLTFQIIAYFYAELTISKNNSQRP